MATTTYGLTSTGFVPKPLQVIRDDLNAALQDAFGPSIDLGDRSILGQLVGIIAERLALLWEMGEVVNSSQDPNKATGAALDALCEITGTTRPAATHSVVTLTLFGAPGTVVNAGSLFETASTGEQFSSNVNATIAAVPNWASTTAYTVGQRVFSDTDRIYQCTVAGTSSSTPVSGPGTDIIDGTVHWELIQDNVPVGGVGAVDAATTAVNTGPIIAIAGDLTAIISGVTGLNTVTNLADATPGRDLATDDELRTLRQEELSGDGKSTADAIRAVLLKIVNLLSCTVFVNNTDFVDSNGNPPHSVEALVTTTWTAGDPLDQQIYDAVWQNVAAGIATVGNQSGTSVDSQGTSHAVFFSRPTLVPIYIIINVLVDPTTFPSDGVTEIQTAITTYGGAQNTGKDAVASAISAQAFGVAGVLDVTSCLIGTAPSPVSSVTIPISLRQLATYDTSRITVNVTNGTP